MPFNLSGIYIGKRCTRDELARLWGYQTRNAIERGIVTPANSKAIILFVTRIKERSAVQYQDQISGDMLYMEGEAQHSNDQALIRAHASGKTIYLFYREKHHNPFIFRGEVALLHSQILENTPSKFIFQIAKSDLVEADLENSRDSLNRVGPTDRDALIKSRRGQGQFRDQVCRLWGYRDSVFGINNISLLNASHIKPWSVSTNEERLSKYNGLLLTPNFDKLFNDGYISFKDDGLLLISKALQPDDKEQFGVADNLRLRLIREEHLFFLRYHRGEGDGEGILIH